MFDLLFIIRHITDENLVSFDSKSRSSSPLDHCGSPPRMPWGGGQTLGLKWKTKKLKKDLTEIYTAYLHAESIASNAFLYFASSKLCHKIYMYQK